MSETIIEREEARQAIVEEIHGLYPDIEWPEPVLEPIYYGRLSKNIIENRKLVLDKKSGAEFDIVSDQYEIVRHEEVLHNMLQNIPEEYGKPEVKTQLWGQGARSMFTMNFPEMPKWEIMNGSEGEVQLMTRNSYDRSAFVSFFMKVKELVCSNGLVAFKEKVKNRVRHITGNILRFDMSEQIKQSMLELSETQELWHKWADIQLGEHNIMEVVEALPYSENQRAEMLELPLLNHQGESIKSLLSSATKGPTLWTVNSAATQFVHSINSEEKKADLEYKIPGIINRFAA
jgi:hypothetical protein